MFRKITYLILLLLAGNSLYSQQAKVDSLKLVLERTTGETRCKILLKLGDAYLQLRDTTALSHYNQSLGLAEELQRDDLKQTAYSQIGYYYYRFQELEKSKMYYEKGA